MNKKSYPRAKKSLGQNFLHDAGIQSKILSLIESESPSSILEIGCGTGCITKHLIKLDCPVLGVELDQDLQLNLEDVLSSSKNNLIMDSILNISEEEILTNLDKEYLIIGNLPYYITTPILEQLLLKYNKWSVLYIMVQKEVGQRIYAKPKTKQYSRLSLMCQYYAKAKKVIDVKRGCFQPAPNVDSMFVRLERKKTLPSLEVTKTLFKVSKIAFSQRRKMAFNIIKKTMDETILEKAFEAAILLKTIRPEAIELQQWITMAEKIVELEGHVLS
ncbi:MAG: ribosomal RNA small subunit methyltransferase A [Candidatus Cloacimonadota bacterium]|nr:MAG: ribosomal RNA small subunit methyltransferase A [Candidatus Cloacimonadota bacterium]